ncbi:MAG: radical SAM protein [Spirochaetaceae bacterium]|nr:MAG: radical SAM protein [Spirochaetaceae bacterium]
MKNKPSILFIEPRADNLNIFSRYNLPRLGTIILATIMRDKGYDARVYFIHEKELEKMDTQCDIAAISTITATAPQAYRIADYFKRLGKTVIMGGPHVTFLPEEALEHADYVNLGEGEESLPLLVRAIEEKTPLRDVPNLAFIQNGEMVCTEKKPFSAPLDTLPFPDFSLLDYGKQNRIRSRVLKRIIPIQTSRGCPYDCTFCSVTGMFGKRYRYRSTESVLAELERYNPKNDKIFFYDDNFAANKKRTKELLRAMIDRGFKFKWSTQVRSDVAKDTELLELMYQAGCRILYIGFESVDPVALEAMKKSQTAEEIRNAIKIIHKYGIFIHGMFIFGFDTDTKPSMRSTIRFAIKEGIDSAQFMILTPLPGSDFYHEIKNSGRIFSTDWNSFDAHHVCFKPKNITVHQLQLMQIEAHTRFYSPWNVFLKLFRNNMGAFIIGVYAHKINQQWQKMERYYLEALEAVSRKIGKHEEASAE